MFIIILTGINYVDDFEFIFNQSQTKEVNNHKIQL